MSLLFTFLYLTVVHNNHHFYAPHTMVSPPQMHVPQKLPLKRPFSFNLHFLTSGRLFNAKAINRIIDETSPNFMPIISCCLWGDFCSQSYIQYSQCPTYTKYDFLTMDSETISSFLKMCCIYMYWAHVLIITFFLTFALFSSHVCTVIMFVRECH